MPLRPVNNPATERIVFQALRNIITTGTQMAVTVNDGQNGISQVYIHNRAALYAGGFPAIHLEATTQKYRRTSQREFEGIVFMVVEYYDEWVADNETIDAIRARIADDMERVKSNLESNDALNYLGVALLMSVSHIELSPYEGEIDQHNSRLPLVYRGMTAEANILPYDV